MLKDCLEIFEKIYLEKGDSYIIDSYHLGAGSYVLIDYDGNVEKILEINKNNTDTSDKYYYTFAQMDYLSKLIDMNKPIDSKKVIHSNNYLTFFIKKENINDQKLTEEVIDNYYEILANPLAKYKKKNANMYMDVENEYGKSDPNDIEKKKRWIKENIYLTLNKVNNDKNYLKVFFKAEMQLYKAESEKYIIPNIYNNAEYNIEVNGKIFGLPNNNMNLNSKKPYLENKSRKNTLQYLISTKEVLIQKKFFDYLMNHVSEGKTNIYISNEKIQCLSSDESPKNKFTGYFLRLKKGKEVEIHDFDTVTGMDEKINGLTINKVIPIDYEKLKEVPNCIGEINTISALKDIIDKVYFNKYLTTNYFTQPKDIKLNDFVVKDNLLKSRTAFFNWFYKGDVNTIKQIVGKVTIDLMKNAICNGYIIKVKEQFNFRCALLKYFGGKIDMADIINKIAVDLREKINSQQTDKIDTDNEYYFAVGQLVSYLVSLNKYNKRTYSLINPIMNCKTNEKLKGEIIKLFKKYNYAIKNDSKRFNNLNLMILGYVPEQRIKEDILVAGYLYDNLIYENKLEV